MNDSPSSRWSAVIFDLDDTLYDERLFMRGGFQAVAAELEHRGVGTRTLLAEQLLTWHTAGQRERVLNLLAEEHNFPAEWIPELAQLHREHPPQLEFYADFLRFHVLQSHRWRFGCVTDGHAAVQARKLQALSAEKYLHTIIITDQWGREYWKPHPRALIECCRRLEVPPERAVFVGDNPARDMRAARAAGLKSIRIRHPGAYFAQIEPERGDEPDGEITSLDDLAALLDTMP